LSTYRNLISSDIETFNMPALVTAPIELVCDELAEVMFVKNTFIDVQSPPRSHGANRRTRSSPIFRLPKVSLESHTRKPSPNAATLLVLPFSKPDSQASTDGCSEASNSSEDIPNTPLSTPRSQASFPSSFGLQGEDDSTQHSAESLILPPPAPWHSFQ